MILVYVMTSFSVIAPLIADPRKTVRSFRVAVRKMIKIGPAFSSMTVLVSVVLYLVSDEAISRYLGHEDIVLSLLIAYAIGSISQGTAATA